MLVIGDKEMKAGAVAVRTRDNEDRGAQPLADFVGHVSRLIAERSMEL
jgi:threonyl-tRNA synthetase